MSPAKRSVIVSLSSTGAGERGVTDSCGSSIISSSINSVWDSASMLVVPHEKNKSMEAKRE